MKVMAIKSIMPRITEFSVRVIKYYLVETWSMRPKRNLRGPPEGVAILLLSGVNGTTLRSGLRKRLRVSDW